MECLHGGAKVILTVKVGSNTGASIKLASVEEGIDTSRRVHSIESGSRLCALPAEEIEKRDRRGASRIDHVPKAHTPHWTPSSESIERPADHTENEIET